MHKLRETMLNGGKHPVVSTSEPKRPALAKASLGASLTGIPVKRETTRMTHQRAGDRLPGVMGETALTVRRRKYDAAVINLSSDGVMVEGEFELLIGDRATIALPDGTDGKCVVRWLRDRRAGLEFDCFSLQIGRSETGTLTFRRIVEPNRKITDRPQRRTMVWGATLHAAGEMVPVKLRNVSATGAQLDCDLALDTDTKVLLALGGAGFMPSNVRWCEAGRMGLSFDRNFDVEMLSVCASQEEQIKAIEWVKPEYLMDELSPDSPWAARFDKLTLADLSFFR